MSDSYASMNYANDYFEGRELWDSADITYLVRATRLIDQLNFAGEKHDPDQDLEFPRGNDSEVPEAIKKATCELAYALLDGADPEREAEAAFQTASVFDVIRINRHQSLVPTRILHGIVSQAAWNYIRPIWVSQKWPYIVPCGL